MGIHLSCNPIVSCHFGFHQQHHKDWFESKLEIGMESIASGTDRYTFWNLENNYEVPKRYTPSQVETACGER